MPTSNRGTDRQWQCHRAQHTHPASNPASHLDATHCLPPTTGPRHLGNVSDITRNFVHNVLLTWEGNAKHKAYDGDNKQQTSTPSN